jgi:hypothetical protein
MKYSILLAALLSSLGVNAAEQSTQYAHIQYTFRDTVGDNSGDPNRQGANFTFGKTVKPGITLDAGSQFRTERLNNNQGQNTNRLEVGATGTYGVLNNVELYTRGAMGQKFTQDEDHAYYSIESGAKMSLTPVWAVKAGYRYRDSFDNSYSDRTNTIRLGTEYALDKTSSLTLGVDRAYGDSDFVGVNAGYQIKF